VSVPSNFVQVQGQGAVSADQLNTLVQNVSSFVTAANFIGTANQVIYILGFVTPGDGGEGFFWWNPNAIGPGDGLTLIIPNGAASGGWVRVGGSVGIVQYSYVVEVPLTGFNITIPNGVSSLILNPAGTLATGTIHLPTAPVDQQIVVINSMQTVTAVSWAATFPAVIINAPSTVLLSGPGTSFQYVAPSATWFRFG
jgi:hypothetical protein